MAPASGRPRPAPRAMAWAMVPITAQAIAPIIVLIIIAGVAVPSARASVVRVMSSDELSARADAIVEGNVLTVEGRWNPDHTGLETHVAIEVVRTRLGRTAPVIEIVQPGGEVDGNRHIIEGMPGFAPGEPVRLYLRRLDGQRYRVFGWAQGKWLGRMVHGELVYAPAAPAVPAAVAGPAVKSAAPAPLAGMAPFAHNGMIWPASKIPVQYLVHQSGSDDLPPGDALGALQAAFASWQAVPCSSLAYTYAGPTDLPVAVDGQNVIAWIESGWIYGEEAAAATSLWIPIEEERTADIAFNGQSFTWAMAPDPAISFSTLDIQAVATHELGHFSGLSHTQSSLDTMYISWRPWAGQRSLSADDARGLCALYPQPADQCTRDRDCAEGTCIAYEHGTLCTPAADAIGAACSYQRVECEHFCLFTATDLSTGYCSRLCEQPSDCPAGFRCAAASAGGQPVEVCFAEPTQPPDAGPGPDPDTCITDEQCPAGRHCAANGQCDYQCVEDFDCPAQQTCAARGRCQALASDPGGCGCQTSGHSRSGPWLLMVLSLALGSWRRRAPSAGTA